MRYLISTVAGLAAFRLGVHCIDLDGLEGYEPIPEPSGNKYLLEDLADDLPVQTDLPLSARAVPDEFYSYEPTHVPNEDLLRPGSKSMHDYFHGKHQFPHVARGHEEDFDDNLGESEEHFRMLMARDAEDAEIDWDAYPPVPRGAEASILSARGAREVDHDAYPPVPIGDDGGLFARSDEQVDYDAYPPVPVGADTGKIFVRDADNAEIDYDAYPPVPAGADTGKIFARDAYEIDYDAYPPVRAEADADKIFARDTEDIDYNAYPPIPADANTLFARDAEEIDYDAYPPVPVGADATTLLARDLTHEELHDMQAREAEPEAEPLWWNPSRTHTGTWPAHTHPTAPPTEHPSSEPHLHHQQQQHEHQHSMFARTAAPSETAKSEKTKKGWFNFFTKGKDLADEPARRHHPRLVNVGYKGVDQNPGAHESQSHVGGGHRSHHTHIKTRTAI